MLNPIQFVNVIHLRDATGDPRAFITRQSLDIPKKGLLRIHTNGIKAIPYGIPFPTALDTSWYRHDITIQFVGDTASVQSWERCAAWIRAGF
jgi:hypothetical protein